MDSREGYFKASRAGRGLRIDRRGRAGVWKVIEAATREMEQRGVSSHLQVAAKAAGYQRTESAQAYRHVIVDEAQDLHESQWRLLRRSVANGTNDLFIVGDLHQRIYDRRSSLSKVGIDIVGRSKKLKINYRTTRQKLRWSLAVLGEGDYDDVDDSANRQDIAGYHRFLDGAEPTCVGFRTRGEMIEALVEQVTSWINEGVDESGIAVVARTKQSFDAVEKRLKAAGIAARQLGPELGAGDGVAIGTMHHMKGLEARCVAIIDASADQIPNDYFLTPESDDPGQHARDLRIERSLLYVASTRARDDLWVGWPGRPSRFLEGVLR